MFGKVVESVAEDALGAGKSALVLEDAVRARQVVLFSLDVAGYQDLAPKLGAWVLLDLVRVAGVLQYEGWGEDHTRACYVVVDEFGALGAEGRHVVHLLERSREAGMACVLASHGLADLERINAVVVKQIVQNTGNTSCCASPRPRTPTRGHESLAASSARSSPAGWTTAGTWDQEVHVGCAISACRPRI